MNRIWQGIAMDSTLISFCDTIPSLNTGMNVRLDTAHTTLWRSGSSSKAFFSGTAGMKYGIMTDTASPYTSDLNEWFSLKLSTFSMNPIVSFRHRYQTDSGSDGGIVEYSFDSTEWNNVINGCFSRVFTDSFYNPTDTIIGGKPGFSGTSGWKVSTFQFFRGLPLKQTADCDVRFPVWIRFRFRSDSETENLAGWQIQWIKLEADRYSGSVPDPRQTQTLAVFPNPSADGIFNFPELPGSELMQVRLSDVTGRVISESGYFRQLDLSKLQPGQYFYQIGTYRGRLLRQ